MHSRDERVGLLATSEEALIMTGRFRIGCVLAAVAFAGTGVSGQDRRMEPLATFDLDGGNARPVAFSRDGEQLIAITNYPSPRQQRICAWRIGIREKVLDFEVVGGEADGLSTYGEMYALEDGGRLRVMRVQDKRELVAWDTGKLQGMAGVEERKMHDKPVSMVRFAEDDSALVFLFVARQTCLVRLNLPAAGQSVQVVEGDEGKTSRWPKRVDGGCAPGRRLVAGITDSWPQAPVKAYDCKLHVWNEKLEDVAVMPLSKGSKCLDVYERDGVIRVLCGLGPRWMILEAAGPALRVVRAGVHVPSGDDGNPQWNATFGKGGLGGRLSADGQSIVTYISGLPQDRPSVKIWSVATSKVLQEVRHEFRGEVWAALFSPDGRRLCTYVRVIGPPTRYRLYVWGLGAIGSQGAGPGSGEKMENRSN
jgi:hypothetical protein